MIHGAGRADIPAKLHLLELVPYLIVLLVMTHNFGIAGAAMAWTARAVVDGVALTFAAVRVVPQLRALSLPLVQAFLVALAAMLLAGCMNGSLQWIAAVLGVAASVGYVWFCLFDTDERKLVVSLVASRERRTGS